MGTSSEVEVARFFDVETLDAIERLVQRGCSITWHLRTPDGAVPLDVMERLKVACFRRGVAMRTANVPLKGRLLIILDQLEQLSFVGEVERRENERASGTGAAVWESKKEGGS